MNHEQIQQVKNLSDEELNAKIAELEGWTGIRDFHGVLKGMPKFCRGWIEIPDYVNDLNVIHELVSSRGLEFSVAFAHAIYAILGHHDHVEIEAINVNSRTRAEAFVLALKGDNNE